MQRHPDLGGVVVFPPETSDFRSLQDFGSLDDPPLASDFRSLQDFGSLDDPPLAGSEILARIHPFDPREDS